MTRLQSIPGDGVLARRGDLVVLCSAGDHVERVLADLAEVAGAGGDATTLAERLTDVGATGLGLVVFGPGVGGTALALWGHVWIAIATEFGEQRLTIDQSLDGVRTQVPGRLRSVRAGLGEVDDAAQPQRWTDLDSGVARAAALVLIAEEAVEPVAGPSVPEPATAPPVEEPQGPAIAAARDLEPVAAEVAEPPAPPVGPPSMPEVPAPVAAVDRQQPFSSVLLVGAEVAAVQTTEREALPIAARPAAPPAPDTALPAHPVADDHVEVLGVYCKNGHFDDPAARYCAICGISMAQQTLLPRLGPRPPLGVLVLDDGSIFSLDFDYVIGRDPSRDPDVAAGMARPLRVDDPEGLLSRAHARVHLDGWQVTLLDLGSANGTGVWGPRDSAWSQIPRGVPVVLRPGTQVGMGRRQLRYESHRNT